MQDFLYTPPAAPENVPDTTKQASLAELFNLMSATMLQMANRVADLEAKLNNPLSCNLEEALMDFLTNGEFEDRVNELIEHHMRHNFDIDDHIDVADVVRDVINSSLTISFDI
jgi:hypothetical protein